MSAKAHWKLLVFSILCQGIINTFAEKDIDESSELLVRHKRVINRMPGGDTREQIKNIPYIVTIRKYRHRDYCVGVILSTSIVLTLAQCVAFDIVSCRVQSGTARLTSKGSYVTHNVTDRKLLMSNNTYRPEEGIALINVAPSFSFSVNTRNIQLYEGHINPGSYGTISGWGCHAAREDPGTAHPSYLRSIRVPIISNSACAILYTDIFTISDSDICTFDSTGYQYCGVNDRGAPLVIPAENNIFKLVGIHLWSARVGSSANPDVFVNLLYPRYKEWIMGNFHTLNHNHHK